MAREEQIIQTVLKHYPETQAAYLFGTFGTDRQFLDSDVDISLPLPHQQAGIVGTFDISLFIETLLRAKIIVKNCTIT